MGRAAKSIPEHDSKLRGDCSVSSEAEILHFCTLTWYQENSTRVILQSYHGLAEPRKGDFSGYTTPS